MFERRTLPADLGTIRETHAPGALVLDAARDFESLDPAIAESLGVMGDALDPVSHPDSWLPDDAPDELFRYASDEFVVGLPGDGGVTWTTQTVPPTVIVKPRLRSSPDPFVSFLVAEALVEVGLGVPEQCLGFYEANYGALDEVVPLDPADTYQLAVGLYAAYVGLRTRPIFRGWADDHPDLHDAWREAGEHLAPRLADLPAEVATGRTSFAAATELAGSGVKHGLDLPAPFAALDTAAYVDHGAPYAVEWAETTFEAMGA